MPPRSGGVSACRSGGTSWNPVGGNSKPVNTTGRTWPTRSGQTACEKSAREIGLSPSPTALNIFMRDQALRHLGGGKRGRGMGGRAQANTGWTGHSVGSSRGWNFSRGGVSEWVSSVTPERGSGPEGPFPKGLGLPPPVIWIGFLIHRGRWAVKDEVPVVFRPLAGVGLRLISRIGPSVK